MSAFIVVARFVPGTEMSEVLSVVKEERSQVTALTEQGRVGSVHVSMPRQTVFIEAFADDEAGAEATVRSLPMARWWTLDVYPTPAPVLP
jgi:hypothetical protein